MIEQLIAEAVSYTHLDVYKRQVYKLYKFYPLGQYVVQQIFQVQKPHRQDVFHSHSALKCLSALKYQ